MNGIEIGVWQGGRPAGTCFPRTGRDSWAVVFTKTTLHAAHNKAFAYSKSGGRMKRRRSLKLISSSMPWTTIAPRIAGASSVQRAKSTRFTPKIDKARNPPSYAKWQPFL